MSVFSRALIFVTSLSVTGFISAAPHVHGQSAFFVGVGDLPGGAFESRATDISGDGSVVVGYSKIGDDVNFGQDAFRWTRETGMVGLGAVGAYNDIKVSTDGSTAIGPAGGASPSYYTFRWTQAGGVFKLPSPWGIARGINRDGTTVVGQGGPANSPYLQPLIWTPAGDTQVLGLLQPVDRNALDVSDDGDVVVGHEVASGVFSQFIWSAGTGFEYLSQPAAGLWTGVKSLSGNGRVIVGEGDVSGERRVLRWTKESGSLALPPTPDGAMPFYINGGISADGSVIVGAAKGGAYANSLGNSLFIWDPVHGSRNLQQLLVTDYGLGVALSGWTIPSGLSFGVSGDGRSIFGDGRNPQRNQEGWVAFLGTPVPEPSALALAGLTWAAIGFRIRIGNYRRLRSQGAIAERLAKNDKGLSR